MKLPTLDTRSSLAPVMEELLAESGRREPDPLTAREMSTEVGLGALLIAACAGIAALSGGVGHVDVGPVLALTVAYAFATRVRFYVGAAYTVPTQLVLIPILFAAPHALAP